MTSLCEGVLLGTLLGAVTLSDQDKVLLGAPLPETWWLQVPVVPVCDLCAVRCVYPSFPVGLAEDEMQASPRRTYKLPSAATVLWVWGTFCPTLSSFR